MEEFFYSKSIGLYVARKPLKIGSRVKQTTQKNLRWDDEGRINYLSYDDAKRLLDRLGSTMLSLAEYWMVLADAYNARDDAMIAELTSSFYCEWIDTIFLRNGSFIHHPKRTGRYTYTGLTMHDTIPFGRPGWFSPKKDMMGGFPTRVLQHREKFSTTWKYWSPEFSVTKLDALASIRGYVTSVGKPSWDLGIPVDSQQPVLFLRECRKKPFESKIDEKLVAQAQALLTTPDKRLFRFLARHGKKFRSSQDVVVTTIREHCFDALGSLRAHGVSGTLAASRTLCSSKSLTDQQFVEFILGSRAALSHALTRNHDIVFVMGHKNPDTDTVISSLLEAWRNHVLRGDTVVFIPVVQAARLPDEIKRLLDKAAPTLARSLVLTTEKLYADASRSGLARWISVDQNREPEVQRFFTSIIDHHRVCSTARNQEIPKTLEMLGSTAALIARKFFGMGLDVPKIAAFLLYGAALMDTENRVAHKMTSDDVLLMHLLQRDAGVDSDNELYQELMSCLLETNDAHELFHRDYKEDWGFGFAVAKVKNCMTTSGRVLRPKLFTKLRQLGVKNNRLKNLPLTLVKITDYCSDNERVNRERIYTVFNRGTPTFRAETLRLLESIIRFEFPDNSVKKTNDYVEFWGTGMQLSRKKTAPVLEPIVKAFNEYFYSSTLRRWVKRDFLKKSSRLSDTGLKLHFDAQNRVHYITFPEAKIVANRMEFGLLSLHEYWAVLFDATRVKDRDMLSSLQGSNFVEFLDSAIIGKKILIDHPRIVGNRVLGKRKIVHVPLASPGLIHPNDINQATGIPMRVRLPNEYGNDALWRYWAPDADLTFPCRSYIFLLGQPCWDGKFHLDDNFPNLGIRPVVRVPPRPKLIIHYSKKFLEITLLLDGDTNVWRWPKKITEIDIE